ncbi:MAG: methionyl-tRNA formyltransferase [bacterium]
MKILYVTRRLNHSGYLILNQLIKDKFDICGVLLDNKKTLFDAPILRHLAKFTYLAKCWYYRCYPLKTTESEEILAKKNKLDIIISSSIKNDSFYYKLINLNPDIIVLGGGWHELIPTRVHEYPKLGCINTHPSLLPEFRGTSITRWQVLYGVNKSGSTIHYVDENFDTGKIVGQKDYMIDKDYTPQQLFYNLGVVGANLMREVLMKFKINDLKKDVKSNDYNSKYCSYFSKWKWSKDKLIIDWSKNFRTIHCFVLANTQESYQYLGPIFSFKGKSYFLRITSLHSKDKFITENTCATGKDNNIYVVSIKNGTTFLYRKDEHYVLGLDQIQPYNKFYKFIPGLNTSNLFKNHLHQKVDLFYEK